MTFCCELHDGHIPVQTDDKDRLGCGSYTLSYKPREYGLAMVQLDNDNVIAICTTDDVHRLGIEDGTVITKWNGMEYLVIDLRNNQGGYDEIVNALCDLFTTDDLDHYAVGIRGNGNYKCTAIHGIRGDGEFTDLKVVALTNFGCLSAGDGASLYLSGLPDVTLAGLTDPYGCNQETGGVSVLSGGHVYVGFPVGLVLDGNGDPNIDTRADRISRNPVDERIPLDYDAAMKIFRDKEDYELEWAIQYLENSD